jgi:hypothetical protein
MFKRRFKLDPDHFRIDMSWRMATSMAVGLIFGAAGAVTWAYAYGKELVATADAHRTEALLAYPTWPQVIVVIREERRAQDMANEQRHTEVMKRLERIEDRIMRR